MNENPGIYWKSYCIKPVSHRHTVYIHTGNDTHLQQYFPRTPSIPCPQYSDANHATPNTLETVPDTDINPAVDKPTVTHSLISVTHHFHTQILIPTL